MRYKDWKSYTLNDIAVNIFSGGTPNTRKDEYWNGELNWLSSGETRDTFITSTENTITELGVKESSTRLAKIDDIVIASAGQGFTRGQTSLCKIDTYINQSLISIRCNQEVAHYVFVFYNLRSRYEELRQISDGHSIRGSLTTKMMKSFDIKLPDLETQKATSQILYSLDDKIEINNKINSNLEELAQTLYKRWFVDFEFPNEEGKPYKSSRGEMVESELGLIPKGFETTGLSIIADFLNGVIIKKYPEIPGEDSIPVIKIKELGRGNIDFDSDRCSKLVPEKFLITNGDIVFSWSGTLMIDIWTGEDAILNQHLFKVTSASYPKWFYYLATYMQLENFKNIARSMATTLGHIKRSDLDNTRVAVPTAELIEQANKILTPIIEQMISLRRQNNRINSVRDLLLPKLMSGEIEV